MEESLAQDTDTNNAYYVVGSLKLALLSMCTLGLFDLYWFYRNWKTIKTNLDLNIMPFWRAFFSPLWGWSLATHINSEADSLDASPAISAFIFGSLYFVLSVLWRVPDPYWLVSTFTFVPILLLQNTVHSLNGAYGTVDASLFRFNIWNWMGVVIGGAFFTLIVIASFLVPEA